jgi:hypothetical protein
MHVNEHQLARERRTFKYLGIIFSKNLTWSDHLNNNLRKLNQRIGLLRRIKAFMLYSKLDLSYNALILPLFDYGDINIWGDKNTSSLMDQLQVLHHLPTDANYTE